MSNAGRNGTTRRSDIGNQLKKEAKLYTIKGFSAILLTTPGDTPTFFSFPNYSTSDVDEATLNTTGQDRW